MSREHNERRFPRVPAEVVVLVAKTAPGAEGFGKTRTVGLGGCCFVVPESLGVGSTLELSLAFSGRVVIAQAQVVYEIAADRGFEVGVEFLRLEAGDRQFLRRYLVTNNV